MCTRMPTNCQGCMYKGQEYQVGATITEGDCEECMCYETLEGEMQMNCYPSCNISPSVCKAVSWLLVLNVQKLVCWKNHHL